MLSIFCFTSMFYQPVVKKCFSKDNSCCSPWNTTCPWMHHIVPWSEAEAMDWQLMLRCSHDEHISFFNSFFCYSYDYCYKNMWWFTIGCSLNLYSFLIYGSVYHIFICVSKHWIMSMVALDKCVKSLDDPYTDTIHSKARSNCQEV